MRESLVEPLACEYLEGNCNHGISCDLMILNTRYTVGVRYIDAASGLQFKVSEAGSGGIVLGIEVGPEVNVSLPSPSNTLLTFTQIKVSPSIWGFQVSTR